MFPTLTAAQMARLEAYGKRTSVAVGEILAQSGEREGRVLVVLSGSVEILRMGLAGEERRAPADVPARGGHVHHQARRQELIKR